MIGRDAETTLLHLYRVLDDRRGQPGSYVPVDMTVTVSNEGVLGQQTELSPSSGVGTGDLETHKRYTPGSSALYLITKLAPTFCETVSRLGGTSKNDAGSYL